MPDRRRPHPDRNAAEPRHDGTNPIHAPARRYPLLLGLLLLVGAVTAAAHWPVLSAGALSLDDQQFLTDNPLVRNPSWASAERFFGEVLRPSTVQGYYLPLSMVSLMLDYAMGGRPEALGPFHRTSLLLHVLNTLLLVALLYGLFHQPLPAAFIGLLFGVHPLTVEPIAWVGERKTLLAACFALVALLTYVRHTRHGGRRWLLAALLAYVLALLSKPTAAPLPLLLLVLDYWPLQRLTWRRLVEKVPFFVVGGVFAVITFVSHARTAGIVEPSPSAAWHVPLMICHLIVFYLGKIVWPANLTSVYPLPVPLSLANPMILLGVVGTVLLVAALLWSARRTRALVAGAAFSFIAILPTLGVVQYSWITASDKYVYLPVVGLLIVLAGGAGWIWRRVATAQAARGVVVVAVVGLAAAEVHATRDYLTQWRDSVTLGRRMVRLAPQTAQAHDNLGYALFVRGEYAAAVPCFREALRLDPEYGPAAYDLGESLRMCGQLDAAVAQFQTVLATDPKDTYTLYGLGQALQAQGQWAAAQERYAQVVALVPDFAEAQAKLGTVLAALGRFDEATGCYQQALRLAPGDLDLRSRFAGILASQGRFDDAVAQLQTVLAAKPDHPEAHYNLASVWRVQGREAEALEHYRQALAARPGYAEAQYGWGTALRTLGQHQAALEHFREAARLKPDWVPALDAAAWTLATHPAPEVREEAEAIRLAEHAADLTAHRDAGVLDTLAAAYASAGRFDRAVAIAQQALALIPTQPGDTQAARIAAHLELYRAQQPYREPETAPSASQAPPQAAADSP